MSIAYPASQSRGTWNFLLGPAVRPKGDQPERRAAPFFAPPHCGAGPTDRLLKKCGTTTLGGQITGGPFGPERTAEGGAGATPTYDKPKTDMKRPLSLLQRPAEAGYGRAVTSSVVSICSARSKRFQTCWLVGEAIVRSSSPRRAGTMVGVVLFGT